MDSKAKEIRNAYMREWRIKNKDKVKAHQDKYWQNKAEILKSKGEGNSEK